MAGNRIDINLSVQDQGNTLQGRTNDAKKLNQELERSQNLMRGTKTGQQAMRRAGFSGEVGEYNQARGAGQAAGGTSRDFADQSRGLGGLIRLYAIYAANIFAVERAFTALRQAMQTDIMISGLEQLSAKSGVAMGGLAKEFTNVTGGALSFRESMQATAKAVSSGLSSSQFLQLGKVAKSAADALGLDTADAVSRLTRGITKLEPELLDELGLFTKTGKAAEEYARKVGKTESELTDFERRQAFANAVLAEGTQKFGEIAQAGNPYDRLLASLKDVAQTILSTVNAVIAPVAGILADNTKLIGAAIAFAALQITKQALPALGQWQKGLKDAAATAKDQMAQTNNAFQEVFYQKAAENAGIPKLEQELKAAQDRLRKSTKDQRTLGSKSFAEITGAKELTESQRVKIAKDIAKYENSTKQDVLENVAAKKQMLTLDEQIKNTRARLNQAHMTTGQLMDKEAKFGSQLWQREQMLANAREKATSLEMRSKVSERVDVLGVGGAIGELYKDTAATSDLSKIGKFKTIALGSFSAIVRGAEILMSAFSRIFFIVGTGIAVFQVLDAIFTKNAKEVDTLNKSLDMLNETTKTAIDVDKKYTESITGDAIIARANAFDGLSESLKQVSKDFDNVIKKENYWTAVFDKLKDLLPGVDSLQESSAQSIGKGLEAAIANVPEGPMREALKQKFAKTLKLSGLRLDADSFTEALSTMNQEDFRKAMKQLSKDQDELNTKFQDSTVYLKGLQASFENTNKAQQTFQNSLKDSSPVAQFFRSAIQSSYELSKALSEVNFNSQLGALEKLSKVDLSMFDPSVALEIAKQVQAFEKIAPRYNALVSIGDDAQKEIDKLNDKILQLQASASTGVEGGILSADTTELEKSLDKTLSILNTARSETDKLRQQMREIANATQDLILQSTIGMIDKAMASFRLKLQQAIIDQQKAIISKLPIQSQAGIDIGNRLAKEAIDVEYKLLSSQEQLAASQDLLRIQIQRLADIETLKNLEKTAENVPVAIKLSGRIGQAGRAEELFQSGTIEELRAAAKENPAIFALLERRLKGALNAQQKTIKIATTDFEKQMQSITLSYDDRIKALTQTLGFLNQDLVAIIDGTEQGIRDKSDALIKLATVEKQKLIQEGLKTLATTQANIDFYLSTIKDPKKKSKEAAELAEVIDRIKKENEINILLFDQRENIRQQNQEREDYLKLADLAINRAERERNIDKERLALQNTLRQNQLNLNDELLSQAEKYKLLTADQIREQRKRNQISRIDIDLETKLQGIAQDRQRAKETALKTVGPGDINDTIISPAGLEGISAYSDTLSGLQLLETQYKATADAQKQLLEAQYQFSLREEAWADAFVKSIDRMTDAIVNFVKTGKFSFKDLVNSFLEDLLRFEVKRAQEAIFSELGGGMGLAKTVLGKFGLASPSKDINFKVDPMRGQVETKPLYVQVVGPMTSEYVGLGTTAPGLALPPLPAFSKPDFSMSSDPVVSSSVLKGIAQVPAWNETIWVAKSAEQKARDAAETGGNRLVSSARRPIYMEMDEWSTDLEFKLSDTIQKTTELTQKAFIPDASLLASTLGQGLQGGIQSIQGLVVGTAMKVGGGLLGSLFGSLFRGGGGFGTGGLFGNMDFGGFFASGGTLGAGQVGIVGETGPEFITGPATITPMGKMGGNVEVVVNNYSSAKAETKETTDARGNRRIEVVVGDMVAGELTRSNSNLQQAMTNNYGTRPVMARR